MSTTLRIPGGWNQEFESTVNYMITVGENPERSVGRVLHDHGRVWLPVLTYATTPENISPVEFTLKCDTSMPDPDVL